MFEKPTSRYFLYTHTHTHTHTQRVYFNPSYSPCFRLFFPRPPEKKSPHLNRAQTKPVQSTTIFIILHHLKEYIPSSSQRSTFKLVAFWQRAGIDERASGELAANFILVKMHLSKICINSFHHSIRSSHLNGWMDGWLVGLTSPSVGIFIDMYDVRTYCTIPDEISSNIFRD